MQGCQDPSQFAMFDLLYKSHSDALPDEVPSIMDLIIQHLALDTSVSDWTKQAQDGCKMLLEE